PGAQPQGTLFPADGEIRVIDVDPQSPSFLTQIGVISASREPYGVKATSDPRMITFTNRRMDLYGFGVIQANTTQTGWTVSYIGLNLGPTNDYLDVNNGQGIAILPDRSYAFVTGFNIFVQGDPSHDPDYNPRQPAGGNIGIIKDPLGLNGAPQLVG